MATTTLNVIDAAALAARLESGAAFEFWNVLTDEYFGDELIPGSRRLPLDRVGREAAMLARDTPVVVYRSGPACPQSGLAAEKLATLGFTRVDVFKGGIEDGRARAAPSRSSPRGAEFRASSPGSGSGSGTPRGSRARRGTRRACTK